MANGGVFQRVELALLGSFVLHVGGSPVVLAPASQRLLAYVALTGRTVRRDGVAGALWCGEPEERAHTNLRSAVARLGARAPGLLRGRGLELTLSESLRIDLHDMRRVALDVIARPSPDAVDAAVQALPLLSAELLPGWYDEWVIHEAEAWRQLRLHALEALGRQLALAGRHAEAVVAAQAAVAGDPLRETAQAVLIDVHLREGNQSEAVRTYERYRRRLHDELGLEPTPSLRAAIGDAAVT